MCHAMMPNVIATSQTEPFLMMLLPGVMLPLGERPSCCRLKTWGYLVGLGRDRRAPATVASAGQKHGRENRTPHACTHGRPPLSRWLGAAHCPTPLREKAPA